MTKKLAGMHVALLTGFSDQGEFDAKRQENILEYVLKQNVTGLYVGGSSGEGGLMNVQELARQQEVVRDKARGSGKQLIAHVGQPSLRESIALAERAQELGYDGLSALPPHAYPFSQEEIFEYYRVLAAATDLPLIVYEVPIRTGRPTPADQIAKLLDLPNVAGLKFTSSDMFALSQIQSVRPDATYFFGFDEIIGGAAALGVDGGIGTTYNILGNLYTALFKAVELGEMETLRELQGISQAYVNDILKTGVIPGCKATLQALGVDCGPARAPFLLRGENPKAIIETAINRPGFQQWLPR